MARIGIHLSYWQRRWDDPLPPLVARAAAAGFDGVEVPLLNPQALPLAEIRAAAQASGVSVTCGTGLGPATDLSSPDPAVRRAGLEHMKRCLEAAASLGAPGVGGVTYAAWGLTSPPEGKAARREQAVAAMRQLAAEAEQMGLTIFLEMLNRFEGCLIGSVEEGKAFVAAVGSPAVQLHLDTFHLNIEADDIGQAIRLAGADLGHFHLSENNRRLPGYGHIPWSSVAAALHDAEYHGPLVVESFVTPDCEVGAGLNIWRSLGADLDGEAAASVRFLREHF